MFRTKHRSEVQLAEGKLRVYLAEIENLSIEEKLFILLNIASSYTMNLVKEYELMQAKEQK